QELLGRAREHALNEGLLRAQLGRLGNTPYELGAIQLEVGGQPFAPASLLNQVRREEVDRLQGLQSAPRERKVELRIPERRERLVEAAPPEIHLLVRTPEQLDAAIELHPASITLDYLDLYGLKPSLDRIRNAGIPPRVASPRILKPGEERIADFLVSCECPILVRPAGLLHALRGRAGSIGDFSLNAANAVSAEELFALGCEVLTPAHDLNAAQVAELARQVGGDRLEGVAVQHL